MRKYIPKWVKLIPQEAKQVFSGMIYEVYQWPQKMFDESYQTFEMLRRPDTVIIIPIVTAEEIASLNLNNLDGKTPTLIDCSETKGSKIIITEQEQPSKGKFFSYPGGRVDHDDFDELAGAKRELLEETGLAFEQWKLINVKQPLNKIDWLVYIFVATKLVSHTHQQLDAGERIKVLGRSFEEVKNLSTLPSAQHLQTDFIDLEALINARALFDYNK